MSLNFVTIQVQVQSFKILLWIVDCDKVESNSSSNFNYFHISDAGKRIYYSQATHITFICPMVIDAFPLDTQICKFQVGNRIF